MPNSRESNLQPATDRAQEPSASDSSGTGDVLLIQERGETEQLRVQHSRYRGERYVDVRVWWRTGAGAWAPSRKGVTLRPDQIPAVIDALQRAHAEVQR